MVDFSLVIQAGGQSTRMGSDKALLTFQGTTLVEYIYRQVAHLGGEQFIITNNPEDFPDLGMSLYEDVINDIGALGGVYSALVHANMPYVLLLACDMPFVSLPLLDFLLDLANEYDAVIPLISDKGYPEPFRAVYSKKCIDPIKSAIDRGDRRVRSFFEDVNIRFVSWDEVKAFDSEGVTFMNTNTPEEFIAAQHYADRRGDE